MLKMYQNMREAAVELVIKDVTILQEFGREEPELFERIYKLFKIVGRIGEGRIIT